MWPLPALLAWAVAWGVFAGLRWGGLNLGIAAFCATGAAISLALLGATPVRRWVIALGFPVSWIALAAHGAAGAAGAVGGMGPGLVMPAWAWLLPLALLGFAYPISTWRDAPLFPTPNGALDALTAQVPLPAGAQVLDAGCGLGHGLAALRRAYPQVQLQGIERSAPIAWAAMLLCRRAKVRASVRRGDMWAGRWSGFAMVYLFQRPETLPRAVEKARAELDPGAWLASLEFPALGLAPQAVLNGPGSKTVWLYQAPFLPAHTARTPAAYVTAAGRTRSVGPASSPRPRR